MKGNASWKRGFNMEKFKKIGNIVGNVIVWVFVAFSLAITIMVFSAQQNTDGIPALFGKSLLTIQTPSMEDTYSVGDMVFMTKLSDEEIEKELRTLETLYSETFGATLAPFYRPPEGKFDRKSLAIAKRLGYHTAFWSLAYADWDNDNQPDPEKAKKLLCDHLHNGAVILLHPTSKTNADILDALLTEWENEGYRFGSLTEFTENDQ
jgi:hypothetical protein